MYSPSFTICLLTIITYQVVEKGVGQKRGQRSTLKYVCTLAAEAVQIPFLRRKQFSKVEKHACGLAISA